MNSYYRATNIEIHLATGNAGSKVEWCLNQQDCGTENLLSNDSFFVVGGEHAWPVIEGPNGGDKDGWITFGIHWRTVIEYFQGEKKLPHNFPLNWTNLETEVYLEHVGYGCTQIEVKGFDVGYFH